MASFTDFLNLFKWNSKDDAEEEFDIDKALNDNWEKIDTKLKTHITNTDNTVDQFQKEVNKKISDFEQETNNTIDSYKNEMDNSEKSFQEEVDKNIENFKNTTVKEVQDLRDSISATDIFHKYYKKIETEIQANTELELPCFYKVGADVLDVYYLGERLIKDDAENGIEGHYQEVGELDSISNKIIVGWDVDPETEEDDSYFEFVVRGEYEGGDA